MDLRKLKKLIDLVQESGIAELEITEGEEKVRIARGGAISVTPLAAGAPPAAAPAGAVVPPAAAAPVAAAAAPDTAPEGHVVKSPMVGTFYRSPSPDAKPFVEVGAVKEYMGVWAEYRVYEGGYTQVVHRLRSPEALSWSERTRHLYGGLYPDYSRGLLSHRCLSYTF